MKWPEAPTCHGIITRFSKGETPKWLPPRLDEPSAAHFRTCGYCGSINPEDLVKFAETGNIHFEGADWKYGWPHKVYVKGIPNIYAGKQVKVGSSSNGGVITPIIGKGVEFAFAKWYNDHMSDDYDDEAFTALARVIKRTGVLFYRKDGRVMYEAGRYDALK